MQGPCIAGAGGNRSSVVITVQDACPGCPAGELALHPLAFARLANLSRNAIPVRYRQARNSCSPAAESRTLSSAGGWRRKCHCMCHIAPAPAAHTSALPPVQVACDPPQDMQVVVEAYNLGGDGWLRLHLEQVSVDSLAGVQHLPGKDHPMIPALLCLPSHVKEEAGRHARLPVHCPPSITSPHVQVGGSGGIQSLWMRSTPSDGADAATDATLAGLQSQWRQLTNLNGTAAWELRCTSLAARCACCTWCMVHGSMFGSNPCHIYT